jgi:hypothetical protein
MEEIAFEYTAANSEGEPLPGDGVEEQPQAWEQIENGRYQPRRIKGSCLGRELG